MSAQRTLVCFGDSNTYGTPPMPERDVWGRFGPDTRWPGVMAAHRGSGWQVVEEALPGRPTGHDDPIEGRDRNGLTALPIVLGSNRPIDLVVVKLGTNDLKARFAVTPEDIADSVGVLVTAIRGSVAGPAGAPAVLVVVPAPILEAGFRGGAEKSQAFGTCYAAMGRRFGVPLVDAGTLIASDPLDGVHLTEAAHATLGHAVAEAVRRL